MKNYRIQMKYFTIQMIYLTSTMEIIQYKYQFCNTIQRHKIKFRKVWLHAIKYVLIGFYGIMCEMFSNYLISEWCVSTCHKKFAKGTRYCLLCIVRDQRVAVPIGSILDKSSRHLFELLELSGQQKLLQHLNNFRIS